MKTTKVTVNRTPDRPQGVELDVIEPEGDLETELVCFMFAALLRDEIRLGRVKLTLPDDFRVEHRGQGAFMVTSLPRSSTTAPYYVPAQALALVLMRRRGQQFELVYSDGKPQNAAGGAVAAQPAAAGEASAPTEAAEQAPAVTQDLESNESSDASVQPPPSPTGAAADELNAGDLDRPSQA